jgi:hypothetical protein
MQNQVTANIGERTLIIETGKVAKQADGAVTVRLGETIVLVAAVAGQIDPSAPSGTYYIQLIDSAAPVNSGGAITPIAIIIAPHTTSLPTTFSFEASIPVGGIAVSSGCVLQLSTTYGVGTLAGAYLNAAAARSSTSRRSRARKVCQVWARTARARAA